MAHRDIKDIHCNNSIELFPVIQNVMNALKLYISGLLSRKLILLTRWSQTRLLEIEMPKGIQKEFNTLLPRSKFSKYTQIEIEIEIHSIRLTGYLVSVCLNTQLILSHFIDVDQLSNLQYQ